MTDEHVQCDGDHLCHNGDPCFDNVRSNYGKLWPWGYSLNQHLRNMIGPYQRRTGRSHFLLRRLLECELLLMDVLEQSGTFQAGLF